MFHSLITSHKKYVMCELFIQSTKNSLLRFTYFFCLYFYPKVSNWSSSLFKFQFDPDFWKIDAMWSFSLNLFKQIKDFSSKLKFLIMIICFIDM